MSEKSPEYYLLDEPWIPVLWINGEYDRVGIRRALTEASRIRQLAAPDPMDNVALLQWCKPSLNKDDRGRLDGEPNRMVLQASGEFP